MATNTTATSTTHTGNGSTNNFAISFSFLANAEIDVTVAGVLKTLDTHYTISGSTVTFTSGNTPANGAAIKFQRDTDISAKKVDFQDGSVLTETDLDTNSDQVLFAQQEITDKLGTIEEGATGDQTAAEIRALVESATDSNVFTDADHSKLDGMDPDATDDQTAAEIRALVESASDSNVFTDADHTKLNSVESGATADQTNAEIRAAVEAATDSNVFTDADHTKLNSVETGATADQTVSEIKSLIAGSPLDASHLAANSVDSSELVDGSVNTSHLSADCVDSTKIADNAIGSEHLQANSVGDSELASAALTTLAGMQSGTASKLADNTALTADLADLNQLDGMAKQTTITDDDTKFPTSGAIVDYVAAQIAPIGGFEVIATDAAFPNTQPASGVVISIADGGGLVVNGSGTSTTGRTVGGSTVTINNFASNFNSSTVDAGVAILVSSTGSNQVYNYHKATLKEADLLSLSGDINDFAERYRVVNGEPNSGNDEGDLIYDKNADAIKVFDSSTNTFKLLNSVGDFKFLFLCPTGGSGAPTFDGNTNTFDLRVGSNNGSAASVSNAAQLIVSIDGVIQKPNTGTSQPSEGFAMVDSNTIVFGSNLTAGAEVFISQIGDEVNIGTPADNTVSTAKLQNLSVTEAKLGNSAVTRTKLNLVSTSSAAGLEVKGDGSSDGYLQLNCSQNSHGVKIKSPPHSASQSYTLTLPSNIVNGQFLTTDANGNLSWSAVSSIGGATGVDFNDNVKARFGTGNDLQIWHNGSHSILANSTGALLNYVNGNESAIEMYANGSVALFYDNSKKLETLSDGVNITGTLKVNGSPIASGGLGNVVEDTTPQLGGDLSTNGNNINFGDSGSTAGDRATFGAANDLQIFHNGTDSYILEDGTGHLNIKTNGPEITLTKTPHETLATFKTDGSNELYYDGSKKFETASYGCLVTGNLGFTDGDKAVFGIGSDLQIYHSNGDSFITNTDGNLNIFNSTDGWIRLQPVSGEEGVIAKPNGSVELYYDNSEKLKSQPYGIFVNGSIQIDDNSQLKIGNSTGGVAPLQIYHDGSHSFLDSNQAGGQLLIRTKESGGTTNNAAKFMPTGAVELYYDGSKTFETLSGGNKFYGYLFAGDNEKIYLGNSNDLEIFHNANGHSYIKNKTGALYIMANDADVGIQVNPDDDVRLRYDDSNKLYTASYGIQVGSAGGSVFSGLSNYQAYFGFDANSSSSFGGVVMGSGPNGNSPFIAASKAGNGTALHLDFRTNSYIRMRLDSSGNLGIGTTSPTHSIHCLNSSDVAKFDHAGTGNTTAIVMRHARGGLSGYNGKMISFTGNDGSEEGSINIHQTSVAYNTSSDYRLKENEVAITDGITRLKTLKPYKFNFKKSPDVKVDGFFAHEVSSVVPEAITGTKDEVDSDNNPVYQGIDQSKIVPLLTAALQEAIAKIETLETKVAALEGA